MLKIFMALFVMFSNIYIASAFAHEERTIPLSIFAGSGASHRFGEDINNQAVFYGISSSDNLENWARQLHQAFRSVSDSSASIDDKTLELRVHRFSKHFSIFASVAAARTVGKMELKRHNHKEYMARVLKGLFEDAPFRSTEIYEKFLKIWQGEVHDTQMAIGLRLQYEREWYEKHPNFWDKTAEYVTSGALALVTSVALYKHYDAGAVSADIGGLAAFFSSFALLKTMVPIDFRARRRNRRQQMVYEMYELIERSMMLERIGPCDSDLKSED